MERQKINLGGKLTVVNGLGWLLLVILGRNAEFSPVLIGCVFILTLPLAWPILMPPPGGYPATYINIVLFSCLIGVNSFAWGYGLAAIQRWLSRSGTWGAFGISRRQKHS